MKNKLLQFRKDLFFCLFCLLTSTLIQAQTIELANTNAASYLYSPNFPSVGTYTHTYTIPFYQNQLTGTFKLKKDGVFTCNLPNLRLISINAIPSGAFVVNNGQSGATYVTLPNNYSFPVGVTTLKMSFGCGNLSNSIFFRIVVNKLPDPALNVVLTPYCQTDTHTNLFTGNFGYHVNGTVINKTGLEFNVIKTSGLPISTIELLSNFNINSSSNAFTPNSSFYSSNTNTTYTVKLQYRYTPVGSNTPIVYTIPNGSYGWTNHVWSKTFSTCMNVAVGTPNDSATLKSVTAPITDPNDENRSPRKPKKFTTYPNPTNGVIVIEKTEMDVVLKTITVYDTNNIAIMTTALENFNPQTIDLTSLRSGIYLMNVETNEGVFVEKIVKN
ncbi:T9SS type A sorting domain-containing protein [Flavobacterium sp.]|uniref:T9SS type A sorting domain-containing protein n=1 Tax=Flavobacterium sp. TaxID=239 RepID=UPI0038FCE933